MKKPSHAMFMEMTVRLPRGATSSPLRMKNLGMVLGGFELVVDNLSDGVLFDTIQLMTQDAAIHIGVSGTSTRMSYTKLTAYLGHSQLPPDRHLYIALKAPSVVPSTSPVT